MLFCDFILILVKFALFFIVLLKSMQLLCSEYMLKKCYSMKLQSFNHRNVTQHMNPLHFVLCNDIFMIKANFLPVLQSTPTPRKKKMAQPKTLQNCLTLFTCMLH